MARREPSPDLWTDAWLAALAQAHDLEMVTFDRGFRSYSKLKLRLLEPTGLHPLSRPAGDGRRAQRLPMRCHRSSRSFSGSVPTITPLFVKCSSRSAAGSCFGQVGRPAPFGSPLRAKPTQ